ncbi:MAG: PHB depolymerase family esterase [Myxococcota bacterium]|nr:PHB depolymerase family esterase [Myxococcota bacterium]
MRTAQVLNLLAALLVACGASACQCGGPQSTDATDSRITDTQTDSSTTGLDTQGTTGTDTGGGHNPNPKDPLEPGGYRFGIETPDGRNRIYEIYLPASVDQTQPAPVVFNLHGERGSAELTPYYTQMNPTADAHGFVVVYPQGIQGVGADQYDPLATWNASAECCGNALDQNVDDVTYFRSVLSELKTQIWVDETRVYATGISNGGLMSYRLACEASDLFAAIAPVATPGTDWSACALTQGVGIFQIHGTNDQCAPFTGGNQTCGGCVQDYSNTVFGTSLDLELWSCASIPDTLATWRARQSCPQGSGTETYSVGTAQCKTWAPCNDESQVTLCTVGNMGHTWPGGLHIEVCQTHPDNTFCQAWLDIVGDITTDISNDEIWAFFSAHASN